MNIPHPVVIVGDCAATITFSPRPDELQQVIVRLHEDVRDVLVDCDIVSEEKVRIGLRTTAWDFDRDRLENWPDYLPKPDEFDWVAGLVLISSTEPPEKAMAAFRRGGLLAFVKWGESSDILRFGEDGFVVSVHTGLAGDFVQIEINLPEVMNEPES